MQAKPSHKLRSSTVILEFPSARLTRNAWHSLGYNGAHGFEQAVREAHLNQLENDQPSVLATLGTLASWTRALPVLLLGFGAIIVLALLVALTWALVLLKRERRYTNERVTVEQQPTKQQPTEAIPPLKRLVRPGVP